MSVRTRARTQDGFTMVELMIALALIAIMFMALAMALTATMSGTADSRRNQQSIDLINERMEAYRGADYASVAVITPPSVSALLADSRITQVSPGNYVADVNGAKQSGGDETLLIDAAGAVPLREVVRRDGTTYDVASYVTVPADAAGNPYKRLTTVVSWQQGGTRHERQATTYVAKTQRGLPLPEFTFKSTNPSGDAVYFDTSSPMYFWISLTNRGARDNWTLATAGASWAFEYYRVSGPGVVSTSDPLTGDETGPIQTDETIHIMVHVASLPAMPGGPFDLSTTATSKADTDVAKSVDYRVTVSNSCVGCTWVPMYLHNTTASAGCTGSPCTDPNSTFQAVDLYADLTAPKWPGSIPDFDTDRSPAGPGRWLRQGGDIATEPVTSDKLVQWRRDSTSAITTILPAKTFWFTACLRNSGGWDSTFKVQVLAQKSSGAPVPMTDVIDIGPITKSPGLWDCYGQSLPVKANPSGGNWLFRSTGSASTYYRKLYLRVVNTGAHDIELAYDTVALPVALYLPTP